MNFIIYQSPPIKPFFNVLIYFYFYYHLSIDWFENFILFPQSSWKGWMVFPWNSDFLKDSSWFIMIRQTHYIWFLRIIWLAFSFTFIYDFDFKLLASSVLTTDFHFYSNSLETWRSLLIALYRSFYGKYLPGNYFFYNFQDKLISDTRLY